MRHGGLDLDFQPPDTKITRMNTLFRQMSRFNPVREYRAWLLVAAASLFTWGFVSLTGEILEGETRHFDEAVLLSLRQSSDHAIPVGPPWLTKVMTDLTALGGTTVLALITLLVLIYLLLRGARRTAAFVAVSILGAWLLSSGLKLGIARPRPDLVPHLVEVYDLSFPSGHAMLSAISYLTLGALLHRIEERPALKLFFPVTALLLTFAIGFSRVYLGVHYPTDVIGGWAAGMAWASLSWLAARRLLGHRDPAASKGGTAG